MNGTPQPGLILLCGGGADVPGETPLLPRPGAALPERPGRERRQQ
jgi:hypothetical protein